MQYNLTEMTSPGVLPLYWPLDKIVYPDIIVAMGDTPGDQQYDYVVEFQCIQKYLDEKKKKGPWVEYIGINMYSHHKEDKWRDIMINAARKQGMGEYIDTGLKLRN